ncbi:unnamed protein product [Trichobilharzia regenti]|nr:unnamed protein product [Trichobilharzia regenti]
MSGFYKKETITNPQPSGRKTVDICDLIIDYVTQFPLAKDIKSRINLDDIQLTDIDFTRLQIIHKETEYLTSSNLINGDLEQNSTVALSQPPSTTTTTVLAPTVKKNLKSHVLFSSVFTNNTTEHRASNCEVLIAPNFRFSLGLPSTYEISGL